MLFNSLEYLVFFPTVVAVYFISPHRFRWMLLLAASALFYMAFVPAYILILGALIIADYCAGILIESAAGRKRKFYLFIIILLNVGFLAFFKYYGFAKENMEALANFLRWNYSLPILSILLPIGLSFHIFQAMSYIIEVYRGKQPAEKHLGIYALYIMFFPRLVAGPIERPQHLIHQFREKHFFDYEKAKNGLILIMWGMFKKVVIADRAAVLVNTVYNDPFHFSGVPLIVATVFFAFQLYGDFSGYSDIAVGSARVLGYDIINNFNRPYASRSIAEFWQRWHISLSSWLRDYLYYPLLFRKPKITPARVYAALMATFVIIGLWHGANWTFVIFGTIYGFYLVFGLWTKTIRLNLINWLKLNQFPTLLKSAQIFTTFSLISFAWIFFRAENLHEATYIVRHLFTGQLFVNLPLIALGGIVLMEIVQYIQGERDISEILKNQSALLRWSAYLFIFWLIIFFGDFGLKPFIYLVF